jgi:hypothetical protein
LPIARPAASSAAELIRLPVDKRSNADSSPALELIIARCAVNEATLVLIESGISLSLRFSHLLILFSGSKRHRFRKNKKTYSLLE